MAGQNDFLVFDENSENMLTQALYASDEDRTDGFKTGLARSNVNNKVLRQTSIMTSALGDLVSKQGGQASDTSKSALVSNLNRLFSIKKYYLDATFDLDDVVIDTSDGVKFYLSLQNANTGHALSDTDYWEEIDLGSGGLEIGDIGIAPLGIDETQNKRRYLNGQLIIQEQYTSFTNKLKSAVQLYPSLACTEAQWQATATLSVGGQCGKFVIDDVAGTIRLPKIIMPIQGLTNLANLANIVQAGLPNITGTLCGENSASSDYWANITGAFYKTSPTGKTGTSTSDTDNVNVGLDASLSSSIYGNSSTVQQEQIQYPYFIQVATGVEESVDVVREIEFNNPFSLLEPKWSDKLINNISWLRSNGQSNSSSVYADAYNLILTEYNGSTDETETIGSTTITFRRGATTGMKITIDKTAFNSIYSETGTAWYFVLDTENSAFYLPRSNGFMQFGGTGDFVEAGLPNITGLIDNISSNATASSGAVSSGALSWQYPTMQTSSSGTSTRYGANIQLNASSSSSIYGNSSTVQPPAVQGYLYFYVGETVQNASLINAGRIEEKLIDKADIDGSNMVASVKNFDGSWVTRPGEQIAYNVSISSTNVTYDISNLLPSDNYQYECLIHGYAQTTATTGKYIDVYIKSDIMPDSTGVCGCKTTTNTSCYTTGSVTIPVGSGRTITVGGLTSSSASGTYNLALEAYRRIGTNQ